MDNPKENKNEIKFNFSLILSYIFLGMLVTEIYIIINMFVARFLFYITGVLDPKSGWIVGLVYVVLIYIGFLSKQSRKKWYLIAKSKRFDLLILVSTGIILTFVYDGFGIFFIRKWIDDLSVMQISGLIVSPIIIIGITYLQICINKKAELRQKKDEKDKLSNFMSDLAEERRENDKFDLTNQANNFAENVYNNGSKESLVFGIDAPWGSGKSTFVNFCKEYWEEKYKEQIIVYNFDVLRYEDEDNLFNKFVDGLIKEIKNNMFAPELESLISKYAKILTNSKATISLGPFRFSLPIEEESIDKIVDRLKDILNRIDYKIIIIIDDLDRLNFSSIKEILFVIKKAFTFPNISYVLCYDTQNISILEQQNLEGEEISEFLEKFVNIKTSIFSNSRLLENYFLKVKETSLLNEEVVDSELVINVLKGLQSIFSSSDFHFYIPFIGDLRKLKRLVNLILLLKVDKVDFENTDFDEQDLIHLLIIYIHYPNIFRKIYNTETQGRNGFFSLIANDKKEYENSPEYINYIENLNKNQKFLLNKLFDSDYRIKELEANQHDIGLRTYACFNGSILRIIDRNLEQYLMLIANMTKPIPKEQYNFYLKQVEDFLENRKDIKQIFHKENIESEFYHYNVFLILLNNSIKVIKPNQLKKVINYLLNNTNKYSVINYKENLSEFRNRIPSTLVKLLNKFAWNDINNNEWLHDSSTKGNTIIDYIFGSDQTDEIGILTTMSNKDKGVLGLQDLLRFRFSCYRGYRGNRISVLTALYNDTSISDSKAAPRKLDIASMRKLSQEVYSIFKYQYIDKKINIFEMVEELSVEDMIGEYHNIQTEVNKIKKTINSSEIKNKIIKFIIEELIDKNLEYGMEYNLRCGYYDEKGNEDKQGINESINKYLFDTCFNPQISPRNYMFFLDFILLNTRKIISNREVIYSIENTALLINLNKDFFVNYWKKNREAIFSNNFDMLERTVSTQYDNISYKDDINNIYNSIDKVVENPNNYFLN